MDSDVFVKKSVKFRTEITKEICVIYTSYIELYYDNSNRSYIEHRSIDALCGENIGFIIYYVQGKQRCSVS